MGVVKCHTTITSKFYPFQCKEVRRGHSLTRISNSLKMRKLIRKSTRQKLESFFFSTSLGMHIFIFIDL